MNDIRIKKKGKRNVLDVGFLIIILCEQIVNFYP